jgi:hypothetical protein
MSEFREAPLLPTLLPVTDPVSEVPSVKFVNWSQTQGAPNSGCIFHRPRPHGPRNLRSHNHPLTCGHTRAVDGHRPRPLALRTLRSYNRARRLPSGQEATTPSPTTAHKRILCPLAIRFAAVESTADQLAYTISSVQVPIRPGTHRAGAQKQCRCDWHKCHWHKRQGGSGVKSSIASDRRNATAIFQKLRENQHVTHVAFIEVRTALASSCAAGRTGSR